MTVHKQDNTAVDASDIERLVQDQQVHRDVYISQDVYALEMRHLFANAWVFVGHDSQTPKHGDYFCLLYTSPSPRDRTRSRMPSSA